MRAVGSTTESEVRRNVDTNAGERVRRRVLFLTLGYPPHAMHGLATYTRNMAHALAARGHEVHVLDCDPSHPHADEDDDGIYVHRRRTVRIRGYARLLRWASESAFEAVAFRRAKWNRDRWTSERPVRRIFNAYQYFHAFRRLRTRFDVVESPGLSLEFFLGLVSSAPLVVNLHTPPGFERSLEGRSLGRGARMVRALDRASAFRADVLTAGSRVMVETLRASGWLRSREPLVVPLTVDAAPWSALPSPRDAGPVVLTVGRLDHRKAPDVLVRSAARLAPAVDGLQVVFVGAADGSDDFADGVTALARRFGAPCRFEGQIAEDDLLARFAAARVVAVPSRSESFSLAGLEAMAAGRPVVCTSRVGLSEWVDAYGAGTIVPPDDPAALADALRPYLENPALAARVGEAGRRVVSTVLAPEAVASAREAAYETAIQHWCRKTSERPGRGIPSRRPI